MIAYTLAGILLAACVVSPESNTNTRRSLRVAASPYLSFAPYYLNAFSIAMLNAIARGESVRVVANKAVLDPNACAADGFIARKDIADRIDEMSAEELKLSDVSTPYIADPAARVEAVKNGALDVAFMSEPWITRATEGDGAVLWKSAASIRPGFPLGIVLYGPTLLNASDDDDTAWRFMRAYLQGIARYREGKTDTNVAVLSKVTKLDAELLRRTCWPTFTEDGSVDAVQISEFAACGARPRCCVR